VNGYPIIRVTLSVAKRTVIHVTGKRILILVSCADFISNSQIKED